MATAGQGVGWQAWASHGKAGMDWGKRGFGPVCHVVSDTDADPSKLIPLEAARATLLHWWREPVAGLASIAVGTWDAWHFGRDAGLSANVDELLIIGGIILIAGSRKLFTGANGATPPREDKP